MTSASFDPSSGGVDFNYSISGAKLPRATTTVACWAPGATFNAAADTLITGSVTTSSTAVGTYRVQIARSAIGDAPAGANTSSRLPTPATRSRASTKPTMFSPCYYRP